MSHREIRTENRLSAAAQLNLPSAPSPESLQAIVVYLQEVGFIDANQAKYINARISGVDVDVATEKLPIKRLFLAFTSTNQDAADGKNIHNIISETDFVEIYPQYSTVSMDAKPRDLAREQAIYEKIKPSLLSPYANLNLPNNSIEGNGGDARGLATYLQEVGFISLEQKNAIIHFISREEDDAQNAALFALGTRPDPYLSSVRTFSQDLYNSFITANRGVEDNTRIRKIIPAQEFDELLNQAGHGQSASGIQF